MIPQLGEKHLITLENDRFKLENTTESHGNETILFFGGIVLFNFDVL